MGLPKIMYLGCLVLLLAAMVMVEGASTPPGIAKNPARASCNKREYKMCYNLEHVCPKFCPDSCTVECASCKPICSGDESPTSPTEDDEDDKGDKKEGDGDKDKDDDKEGGKKDEDDDKDKDKDDDKEGGKKDEDDDKEGGKKDDNDDKKEGDDNGSGSSPPYYPPSPTPPSPSTPKPTPPTPTPPTPTLPPAPTTPSPSPKFPTPSSPTPSSPPNSGVSPRKRVQCKNKYYGQCYNQQHVCPASCPTSCQVDCVTCKPVCNCDYPGAVCQDPRFVGGDGTTFYFHGKKNQDFCLVTDRNLHINAHFIGKRNENMGRDFTWVESIGILFDNHRLFIGAKKTVTWNNANDRLSLAFDGVPINLDESLGYEWRSASTPQVTITRSNTEKTNSIVIEVQGKLKITTQVVPITKQDSRVHNYGITNEDSFAHLDLGFKFLSLTRKVEGVLGKTYREDYVSKVNTKASMSVVGGEREYASSNIFATDCLVSTFNGDDHRDDEKLSLDLASMKCASGTNGETGVVCKR